MKYFPNTNIVDTHQFKKSKTPNKLTDGILWIASFDTIRKLIFVQLLKKSHTVVIKINKTSPHFSSSLLYLLAIMPSNIKKLSFMGVLCCNFLSEEFILSKDLTHIDFFYYLHHSISLPKTTHNVCFNCLYEHTLILSKNIKLLSICTCHDKPLIYPKNIIILSHKHIASQYPNMSKNLKYLRISSINYTQFNLSKNIYDLTIVTKCLNYISLPKFIKMVKLPSIVKYNVIFPKHMSCLLCHITLSNNIIIPEELNELNFITYSSSEMNKPDNTFICENLPNSIKYFQKNMSQIKLLNKPNTISG